jgi:phenylalanyl-tRNA synthetase beta chain
MNFILNNEDIQYVKMQTKNGKAPRIANPSSTEYTILREELLPGLMQNLMDNRSESFPQRLCEVSDVVVVNMRVESRCERRLHVAGAISYANANFTEVKSIVEALLANLGLKGWRVTVAEHPSYIEGRVAFISVGRKQVGMLGEIHPQVLNNFGLENPVAAFEIDLEHLNGKT